MEAFGARMYGDERDQLLGFSVDALIEQRGLGIFTLI